MTKMMAKAKKGNERGMALLLALFALLLLSAIGLFMVLASTTETRIDANYSSSLRRYYAARSGLEEVRDRVKYPSSTPGGLADLLPQDVTGNAGGVLYVLNPAGGETVDPTDPTSPYFDDQLCHAYASGVAAKDTKCSTLPGTPNWSLPPQYSIASATQLGYKWIRVTMKTNRIADRYCVDGSYNYATDSCAAASLDTRVCWDGVTEQLSPGGTTPSCDANGMQTVYMLTSLAATAQTNTPTASRKMLSAEIVAPSIRPAGTVTLGATTVAPVLSNSAGIPSIGLDGRPHKLDGTLSTSASCSAIAPLATDTAAGTAQLEQSLNLVRKGVVTQANAACAADGTGLNGNACTAGLWWVRGTDAIPRFTTTNDSSTSTSTGTSSASSSDDSSSGSGKGGPGDSSGGSHGGHHHHPAGVPDPSGACDSTDHACFTNLNLSAPELFATSAVTGEHIPTVTLPSDGAAPFTGGEGNQSDTTIYQPGSAAIVNNGIKAINNFVTASMSDPNYLTVSAAGLAPSYGTSTNPAIVAVTDQTLALQGGASLSGYGILIIPSALEITNASLNWNGIVVIQSATGHVTLNSGAAGFINGALLIQPGAALNLQNSTTAFRLTYSCDAIDLPFTSKPFKIISTAEASF
ncbi:MAG TPA: hypothetical protein VGN44_17005 [Candidatus Angelobacter sp.]|jgi:hypothetical protein